MFVESNQTGGQIMTKVKTAKEELEIIARECDEQSAWADERGRALDRIAWGTVAQSIRNAANKIIERGF